MRKLACVLAVLVAAVTSPGTAAAAPPTREPFDFSGTVSIENLCSFPVTWTYHLFGTQTTFFNEEGEVTMILAHVTEEDILSANGKTISSVPYTNEQKFVFDETGELIHIYAAGLVVKIPLPDGTLFISSGRLDFVAHNFEAVFTPDVGVSGDIEALCSFLADP